MKIIDHTPYLTENGEISFVDQIRAALKFGYSWYPEIKAQQVVIDILNRSLTKGYTLLRNINLPGSNAIIPLILIGPAGVSVIFVTNLKGNFQAKGENWGVIEGGKLQSTRSNLVLLTSRMARSIQRFLEKQGIELSTVDGILVAADPGMHIESVRPIVRVVMSDAIEHFVVTINNSSSNLNPGLSQTIIRMLTEPDLKREPLPTNVPQPEIKVTEPQAEINSSSVPEIGELLPWSGEDLGFEFKEEPAQAAVKPFGMRPEAHAEPSPEIKTPPVNSRPLHFDKKQWALLIAFGVVEIIFLLTFLWIISINS